MADDTSAAGAPSQTDESPPMELGRQIVRRHRGMTLASRLAQPHAPRARSLPLLARLLRKFRAASPLTGPELVYVTEGYATDGYATGGLGAPGGAEVMAGHAAGATGPAVPTVSRRIDPIARAQNMLLTRPAAHAEMPGRAAQQIALRMIDARTSSTVNPVPPSAVSGGMPVVQAGGMDEGGAGPVVRDDVGRESSGQGNSGRGSRPPMPPANVSVGAGYPRPGPVAQTTAMRSAAENGAPEPGPLQPASEPPAAADVADAPAIQRSAADQPLPVVRPAARTRGGTPGAAESTGDRRGILSGWASGTDARSPILSGVAPVVSAQRSRRMPPAPASPLPTAAGGSLPVVRGEPVAQRAASSSSLSMPGSAGAPVDDTETGVTLQRRGAESVDAEPAAPVPRATSQVSGQSGGGSSALPVVRPHAPAVSGAATGPLVQTMRRSSPPYPSAAPSPLRVTPGQRSTAPTLDRAPAGTSIGAPVGASHWGAGGVLPVTAPLPGVSPMTAVAPPVAGEFVAQRAEIIGPARPGPGQPAAWQPLPHLQLARRESGAGAPAGSGVAASAAGASSAPSSARGGSLTPHVSGPDAVLLQRVETDAISNRPAPDAGQSIAAEASASSAGPAAPASADVPRIANEVYELIRQRLVRERESMGSRGRGL